MPYYSVLLGGNGLQIKPLNDEPPITGFFTTRIVWSNDQENAIRAAIHLVELEWKSPPYSSHEGAKSLTLIGAECKPVGFLRGLLKKPSGFTFFSEEA